MKKIVHCLFLVLACNPVVSASTKDDVLPADAKVSDVQTSESKDVMRGYGKIKLTTETVAGANGAPVRFWRFDATSAVHAATVAGKFLADITLSPGVEKAPQDVAGKTFSMVTVPGGSVYTAFAKGEVGYVLAAADKSTLQAFLTASPALAQMTTDLSYPVYLDRFDRYGWGFYGFAPEWNGVSPGHGVEPTDPLEDLDFCAKHDFRFEIWVEPGQIDNSYSINEWTAIDWELAEADKRHIPLSVRFYGNMPHAREYGRAFEQPAPFLQGGWHGPDMAQKTFPHQSWFDPMGRLYMARQSQQLMEPLNDRTDLGSWMSPYGELYHDGWYNMHADYGPSATADWRTTLRDKNHLTLAQVSAMYARGDKPFQSWSEVPIPEMATFAGLPQMIQNLDGEWSVRPESAPGEGLQGEWWKADVTAAPWEKMNLPGTYRWLNYFKKTKWCVRDFDVPTSELAGGKTIYLYNFAKIYGDPHTLVPVYLNGEKVGETGAWGALDVTKYLKPGQNRLAMETEYFSGRVFLSTEEPSVYPYLGPDRNHLWVLFDSWLSDGKHDAWAIALAAMREKDPNRPIKFMAPGGFGTDRWIDLASRFGGFPHFTGEGKFAYIWYKRYSFLYGLPTTSEDAGPSNNVDEMFSTYQRIFLQGLNGHDHVFTIEDAIGRPDVRAWYDNHIAVLKQLGRWDIAGPQVVLFRSTNSAVNLALAPVPPLGEKTRPIQSIWNWDPGRGAFQAIGQSPLYVDDGGLADNKIKDYPILMDCGNEIVTPEALKNIEKWVRAGGTFITLPFTGRSIPSAPDSWPISALTGCKVKALRIPGPGKGMVTIAQNQPLFKELAGKSFPDAGSSMDWQNFEHNILSVELEPGADCQVAANYENGSPAIVVHKLGAGRVVTLGSAFYRQSKDDPNNDQGIWLAGDLETTFLRDLFTQLGQPSVNYTSNPRVYAQRYQTNNGLDEVVVLDNFSDADQTVNLHVTLGNVPGKIYQVALNSITEPQFTADKNDVTIANVVIPKCEVQVFYFRNHDAGDAVNHWWAYQQKIWRSSDPVKVDLSPLADAGWVDPVLDLKHGWNWTQDADTTDAWTKPGFDDHAWQKWGLDVFSAVGADPTKAVHARRTFEVPNAWLKDGGTTTLVAWGWRNPFTVCDSPWKLTLNGKLLEKPGFFNPDVTSLLKKGTNTLALEIGPAQKGKYIGVLGTVYVSHEPAPLKRISLAGTWTGTVDGKPTTVQLPGKGLCESPQMVFKIPADWKDKYTVTYHVKGPREQTAGIFVNDAGTRRHHHLFGEECEVDITPLLRFGQDNTFAPMGTAPKGWDISTIELCLYPKADHS
jgi:hypothetical protein